MKRVLVTGGAGFIGCNFARQALERPDVAVCVLDKLTYAGHEENLADVRGNGRLEFVCGDIAQRSAVESLLGRFRPDAIVNFAAESHVDRSIDDPEPFVRTNVYGAFVLLEAARRYWLGLSSHEQGSFRFLHVSTDEVFGTLGAQGKFSEDTPYAPNSPYSASKAGADHFVRAYWETYGLPTLITNCSNNYGPYQFPEKLIPLMTLNALDARPLPIYGDGGNVRDWLYVTDHCEGIFRVLEAGRPGQKYNIGGDSERTNLDVVHAICDALEQVAPAAENGALKQAGHSSYRDLKTFVEDRPGHDRRYAIDATKIENELGWRPKFDLDQGMALTVRWFVENQPWCQAVQGNDAARARLGLASEETPEDHQ